MHAICTPPLYHPPKPRIAQHLFTIPKTAYNNLVTWHTLTITWHTHHHVTIFHHDSRTIAQKQSPISLQRIALHGTRLSPGIQVFPRQMPQSVQEQKRADWSQGDWKCDQIGRLRQEGAGGLVLFETVQTLEESLLWLSGLRVILITWVINNTRDKLAKWWRYEPTRFSYITWRIVYIIIIFPYSVIV